MKTIYIDSEFKCHTSQAEGVKPVEIEAFEDKCDAYIEGYRYVPSGESWTREDGEVFHGTMLAPWKDYADLAAIQAAYDRAELERLRTEKAAMEADNADMAEALALLGYEEEVTGNG